MNEASLKIKGAVRRLTEACGGQESVVLIPGMPIRRHQQIGEYGLGTADAHARCDVVLLMERDCGLPLVTAIMARATGHVLVKLPEVPGHLGALGRVTAQALKEVGDVFSTLGQQLEDGTITSAEGAQLDKEIDEAIGKLLALKLQARAVAGRGEG